MFRSYDHHQAAYSSILPQSFRLTAVAVSRICNHEFWLYMYNIVYIFVETGCSVRRRPRVSGAAGEQLRESFVPSRRKSTPPASREPGNDIEL
jgi:hypothetical protein